MYYEQIRRARSRQHAVAAVLSSAVSRLQEARDIWDILPPDREELELWLHDIEAACTELLELVASMRARVFTAELRDGARDDPNTPNAA